ncbi:lactonase family protein [Streptomyces sp. VRA16 Mangrove soil]|uniref:lactonase family protein n=1 Tax=Streptomyces sp. VRA16 Mangrove soil TaxID=2817434 RepID=UPI001A9DE915|nr:lactonase family protein [Streptomyces sp. VRA16 Mangrove soil]MBO1330160.1 lactonase family protein [Streptomyces sp. VRA16 Mangrove soil]
MSGSQAGRAYIGSFTAAGGRGIVTASLDAQDGSLTLLDATDALADPSYLTLSGGLLYAVSETRDGAVAAFRTDTVPPQLAAPPAPVDGAGPTHLAVWGDRVLTANYNSGSVSCLPLRADGTPDAAGTDVLRHSGSGPHPQRQQTPHAHQVLPDPSGRWAVSVDLGTDSVRVCALSQDGRLTLHHETALRPGSGPRHLAFHPSGGYAYVLNELTPTLTVCRWDAVDGTLKPLTELLVLPDAGPRGDAYPSEVVVAPDGRFLWTATRGEDIISVFSLDATGESATLLATVSCGGDWPRDLALDPSGRFLYAANERSGDVTWFTVDQESGLPVRGGSVRVPAASCVVFDQAG